MTRHSPIPAATFSRSRSLRKAGRTTTPTKHLLFDPRSYEKNSSRRAKCFTTTMVRLLLPPLPPSTTPTHTTASMMKDYLDVNFYSIFSEAQNHADKFLVAFLLIKLYHTSHLNIPQYFEETATNSLFRFRFRRLAYQAWPLLAQ